MSTKNAKIKKANAQQPIKIRLKAYDHKVLDQSVEEIVAIAGRTKAQLAGPIPLPTLISRYTVLRGPHIDKKSREQFEIRTHRRLLIIYPTKEILDALTKLDLASGVSVVLKS
jgi:small subunit ribosomal protein S10